MIKMLITSSFADLRKEPRPARYIYEKDPLQESQLLFGECLLVHEERDEWLFVEAIEQQKFIGRGEWRGYPGWIRKDQAIEVADFPLYNLVVCNLWVQIFNMPNTTGQVLESVCLGTKLEGAPLVGQWWRLRLPGRPDGFIMQQNVHQLKTKSPNQLGENIIALGEKLLGHPYHWGGLTIYKENSKEGLTSIDCSGLTYLLYRVYGKMIPRDAHDQFLISTRLELQEMQRGDLIFIKYHHQPNRIRHVMLYAGGDEILDANITDKCVVKTTATMRFGLPLKKMKSGDNIGKGMIFFGSIP